jgi:hypothetical protein
LKRQGGGALNRPVADFGVGLPIDQTASGLIEAPVALNWVSHYELRESILLDTTGRNSLLAVTLIARGQPAEALRQQLESRGMEGVAKERLQTVAGRLCKAQRVGRLEWRDEREANEFALAEVFEINGFLTQPSNTAACSFVLPANLAVQLLPLPPAGPRHAPFALPQPGHFVHMIEVEGPIPQLSRLPDSGVNEAFLNFTRRISSRRGYWAMTLTLNTLVDAVPPGSMEIYRNAVEKVRKSSMWELSFPLGHQRPVRRWSFGVLPPAPTRTSSPLHRKEPLAAPVAELPKMPEEGTSCASRKIGQPLAKVATPSAANTAKDSRGHKRRRRKRSRWSLIWPITLVAIAMVGVFVLLKFLR